MLAFAFLEWSVLQPSIIDECEECTESGCVFFCEFDLLLYLPSAIELCPKIARIVAEKTFVHVILLLFFADGKADDLTQVVVTDRNLVDGWYEHGK
jgi:hypothetical protein